jgi:hypothetical protein
MGPMRNWGNFGILIGDGREFWPWIFGRRVQRRGVHVNTLKIGSRVGELCFGGIYRFYAELRRETFGGNFKLDFFLVLLVGPREPTEEGGHLCVF